MSGLEYCLELQSVSLGENLISSLSMKTLEKLRCLHKLRDFNLIGNPISKRIDEKTLCQYLPNLVYLDNAKLAQEYQNDDPRWWVGFLVAHVRVLAVLLILIIFLGALAFIPGWIMSATE